MVTKTSTAKHTADTRTRMIEAAVRALQRQGVAGMSFTDVLADSGAARGAIYHHFPGGKAQLVAEAAARNGADVRGHLAALPAGDPLEVVDAFLSTIRPVLAASATGGGCAVAAVTVGDLDERSERTGPGGEDGSLREVAAAAFTTWATTLARRLTDAGLPAPDADDLATTLITLLEGAHVLCRAAGSLDPYDRTVRTVTDLVRSRYPAPDATQRPRRRPAPMDGR